MSKWTCDAVTTTITEIKITKKGRYALFCATGFLFSIDELTLLRHHIEVGSALDEAGLAALRAESETGRAMKRALDILALRSHTAQELKQKLCRYFDSDTADAVTIWMAELGYLNETEFAERYAAELIERKGFGLGVARARLRGRGVSAETAEQVLAPYFDQEQDEIARIAALVEKKYRAKLRQENGFMQIFGALLRRGFTAENIRAALRQVADGMEIPEEN